MSGWIGVDLDATLARYDGWKGGVHIGEPIPTMVNRVKGWLEEGRDVRIFTARISGPDANAQVHAIRAWSATHLGRELPITNVKDMQMDELWDDRAVQVEKNTGRPIGHSTRGLT